MDREEEVIIASASFLLMRLLSADDQERQRKKNRQKRRYWVSSVFRSREIYSGTDLLGDLRVDNLHFKTFCRMSLSDFDALINLVGPRIAKKDTTFRKCIPAAERLAVTLRYLASGDSFSSLSFLFKISKQTISTIVPEVCLALIDCLKDYIQVSS